MKLLKNCLYNILFFVLCVVLTSCKTTKNIIIDKNIEFVETEIRKDSFNYVSKDEMPILAWLGVQEHTVARYRELKEAGINHNFSVNANIKELTRALRIARRVGIKLIVYCPELETEPEKIANILRNKSNIAGYFLKDEPNRNDFPYLGELTRRIQAVDNKHFCYINLFPNYANSEQLGTLTYREHIQLFLQEVPVQFLSFDHYTVRINDSGERFLGDIWYENLEIISDESRKVGKPFWAFALTTAHKPYPIPTLADLRLQIYSNLAYGAQGIQYFTYWTPQSDIWDFHDGPIDIMGQKTPTWDIVQQMNKEIKGLSGVFLGAKVIKVEHIAINASGENGDVPIGTKRFDFANKPVEASIINRFDIPKNTKAVVSFLKNGNRCYMVVINCNLTGGNNVTFTITGGADLKLIKKDGTAVPASSESSSQTITPGDALIYGWDIK